MGCFWRFLARLVMGEFRLVFSGLDDAPASSDELQSLLGKLPEPAKKHLGKALERITSVPPERLDAAFREVATNIAHGPDFTVLGKVLGVPVTDARDVALAFAMLGVTARHLGPSRFFGALGSLGIISPEKAASLTALLGPIYDKQKPHIEKWMLEQEVAYQVLPNLTTHSWAVDLRPYYREGKLGGFVPVGVLRLGTDSEDVSMAVQLSPTDFSSFFRALEAMKSRMEDLQSYARSLTA
jgi:hypothetical protein